MKKRTRKSELESLLKTISELSGISTEKKEGEKYHLYLDFAACYGGYRLVMVNNETGGHLGRLVILHAASVCRLVKWQTNCVQLRMFYWW